MRAFNVLRLRWRPSFDEAWITVACISRSVVVPDCYGFASDFEEARGHFQGFLEEKHGTRIHVDFRFFRHEKLISWEELLLGGFRESWEKTRADNSYRECQPLMFRHCGDVFYPTIVFPVCTHEADNTLSYYVYRCCKSSERGANLQGGDVFDGPPKGDNPPPKFSIRNLRLACAPK